MQAEAVFTTTMSLNLLLGTAGHLLVMWVLSLLGLLDRILLAAHRVFAVLPCGRPLTPE